MEAEGWFEDYPGIVLQVTFDGRIVESNGVLDRMLGRELPGQPLGAVVDPASSGEKVERFLTQVSSRSAVSGVWELILYGEDTLEEPRCFAAIRDPRGAGLWLLEQRTDPRLNELRRQVLEVNSDLTSTQRELLKERVRLNRVLQDLEEQSRRSAELARTVQEQNEVLGERNNELEELTAELRRSNEALDEFAHVVSHDLKAPLRSIANHAEWLAEDLGDSASDEQRSHVQRVVDRVGRMRAMIQGMLDYARAGRWRAQEERVDVAALVTGAVQLLDAPPGARIEVAEGMPVLETERTPLQQVFVNLIGNALTHGAGSDPRVRVEARRIVDGYEFAVVDNGPGIPARMQERIWTLFHTETRPGAPAGTGIGLAVAKKLVESRGGSIRVESTEGEGTAFRFTWPGRTAASGIMNFDADE